MTMTNLLEWWNIIYVVPFALALLYLSLFVFTGITFGDTDADMDADADLDADADVDGPIQVEAHVVDDFGGDHDVDQDADHDVAHDAENNGNLAQREFASHAEHAGHVSGVGQLLSFLGVGKIPLSLALMTLLFVWGIVGFVLNVMLMKWLGPSSLVGLISVPITLVIAMALTGAFAALIAKVIPLADSKGQRREDLVGRTGDAIYDIYSTFGMASVRNATGDLFQVPCKAAEGNKIPKGTRVVLFEYDHDQGFFKVAPFAA